MWAWVQNKAKAAFRWSCKNPGKMIFAIIALVGVATVLCVFVPPVAAALVGVGITAGKTVGIASGVVIGGVSGVALTATAYSAGERDGKEKNKDIDENLIERVQEAEKVSAQESNSGIKVLDEANALRVENLELCRQIESLKKEKEKLIEEHSEEKLSDAATIQNLNEVIARNIGIVVQQGMFARSQGNDENVEAQGRGPRIGMAERRINQG